MANSSDMLYEEVVVVHRCYDATVAQIQSFIDNFSTWYIRIGNIGLMQVQMKKGNIGVWWYLNGSSFGVGEDKPFYSKIELQPVTMPDEAPTEIKITCQHPLLLPTFFEKFAAELSRTFEEVDDCQLKIPFTGEPRFTSLVEYLIEGDLSMRAFERLFPQTVQESLPRESHPSEGYTDAETPSPMQIHIHSAADLPPKTDKALGKWKKAYGIIKQRREEYMNAFLDSSTKKRIPKNKDYQDAITIDMKWPITERTVIKIKKAGDAGLLD